MTARRLRTLIVFLVLGAIVNVAVAWGCAIWSRTTFDPTATYSHSETPRWSLSVMKGFSVTTVDAVPANAIFAEPETGFVGQAHIPFWSRTRRPPPATEFDDPTGPWTYEFAYGWPLRTAIGELCNRKPTRNWSVVAGIEVLRRNDGSPIPFRALPLRPIWPGFAINTMFYAGVLWIAFAVPFKARRWRRIKRGLCPACAYPVGQSPICTECGVPVKPCPAGATECSHG